MRRRVRILLTLAGACLALGAAPAHADDVYTVHTCRGPAGEPAAPDGWTFDGVHADRGGDCLSGRGGDLVAGPARVPYDKPSMRFGWTFEAPADTRIVAMKMWRTVSVSKGDPWAWNWNVVRDVFAIDKNHVIDDCIAHSTLCRGLGDGTISDRTIVATSNENLARVIADEDCFPAPCPANTSGTIRIHRAEFTLRDTSDPGFVGAPSGDLLDTTRPLAGVRRASFTATDTGGGVYRATLEVDGKALVASTVDDNGGKCAKPFLSALPCRLTASGSIALDTATLPDGPHSLRLLVSDTTESNFAAFGPVQIRTANQLPECDPAVRSPSSVVAGFPRTKRRTITRRSARGIRVVGRIPGAGAGVTVQLLSREQRTGAAAERVGTAVTKAGGAFSLGVPRGPSRRLRAAYRKNANDPFLACSQPLNLLVRAQARLSASPRRVRPGGRVRLRGQLLGGHVPARGKLVTLEARDAGRWREFDTVRTDRRGRFRTSYGFSRRARGSYPMRVRVRSDATYPFALGFSPVVRVRVR